MRWHGRNMVVELHDENDVEELRKDEKVREAGFMVDGEPKLRKPRILIRGVDKEISREELLDAVASRNPELFFGITKERWREAFVPEIELGKRNINTRSWVDIIKGDVGEWLLARTVERKDIEVKSVKKRWDVQIVRDTNKRMLNIRLFGVDAQ
ncbi:unnamed protein product [Nezara viridula]|uniref:Uncharacterized protein n=1 Tax=Nezara viridula TaxID=85310 RepID=A0A9P0GVZ3_NEZVI|nr:unnamed protein product [Nezara viridula]